MVDHEGHKILRDIIAEVSRIVVGKNDTKELLLVALLSRGHVLIEGLPGTAKTTLTRSFCGAIGGKFKRVQGTPDMLPADILGFYLYRPDGTSSFMPGPIFANVVLVDELNRTTPRTQAALLEAMQENQVTIERATYPLEMPFIVVANQVAHGGPGTSPLSEVQIDRFMFRLWSGLPSMEEEEQVLRDIDIIVEPHISPVATTQDIIHLQKEVNKVHVSGGIRRYIINILDGLRHYPDVAFGPSPRAGIALLRGSRALAYIRGRDFVIPDDVKELLVPGLAHRVRINAEADIEKVTAESIVHKVAAEITVPKDGVEVKAGEVVVPVKASGVVAPASGKSGEDRMDIPLPPAGAMSSPDATTYDQRHGEPGRARGPRVVPEWGWLLIILALVLATVMVTLGVVSLR